MAAEMCAAARGLAGLDVAAVLSRDAARAEAFAADAAPGAKGFAEIDAFLAAVDAVYIATPPDQHLAAIEAALGAGRPVLCEKPLTGSTDETARAIALARETGVALMEAIWTLPLPAYRAATAALAGADGARRVSFDFSYPLEAAEGSHFLDPDTGGVLLDRAVYGLAAALHYNGPVARQEAFVTRDMRGLDRAAELRLTHDSGGVSLVTLSFDVMGGNALEIATPTGVARLGPPSLASESLAWQGFGAGGTPAKGGLKQKLKASPALRRLKGGLTALRVPFHGFGASQYAPVLDEFRTVVGRGAQESALVPLALSERIAALVAEARAEDTEADA